MAQKESYFKKIKEPISNEQEGIEIKKQTLTYLLISLGVMIVGSVLSAFVQPLIIVAIAGMIATIIFGVLLAAVKKSLEAFKNLHCDKCRTKFTYNPELVTWKEVSRHWNDTFDNNGTLKSVLKVTVDITCKCPKCKATKSFRQTFQTGKITVDKNLSVRDQSTPTEQFVVDYFNGRMQL